MAWHSKLQAWDLPGGPPEPRPDPTQPIGPDNVWFKSGVFEVSWNDNQSEFREFVTKDDAVALVKTAYLNGTDRGYNLVADVLNNAGSPSPASSTCQLYVNRINNLLLLIQDALNRYQVYYVQNGGQATEVNQWGNEMAGHANKKLRRLRNDDPG